MGSLSAEAGLRVRPGEQNLLATDSYTYYLLGLRLIPENAHREIAPIIENRELTPMNTNETYRAFRQNPLITPLCHPHLRALTTAHPQPRFWLPSTSTSPITAPSRCRSDGPLASDGQYLSNMIGWHEAAVEASRKLRHRVRSG